MEIKKVPIIKQDKNIYYVNIYEGFNFKNANIIKDGFYYYEKNYFYNVTDFTNVDSTTYFLNLELYNLDSITAFNTDPLRYYNFEKSYLINFSDNTSINSYILKINVSPDFTNFDINEFIIILEKRLNNIFLNDKIIDMHLKFSTSFNAYKTYYITLLDSTNEYYFGEIKLNNFGITLNISEKYNTIIAVNSFDIYSFINTLNIFYYIFYGMVKVPKITIKEKTGQVYNIYTNFLNSNDIKSPFISENILETLDLSVSDDLLKMLHSCFLVEKL